MRVIIDYYYNGLMQRCTGKDKRTDKPCDFVVGPYDEEWHGGCPRCSGRLAFFRAFGSEEARNKPLTHTELYILANTDNSGGWWGEWWGD